MPNFDTINEVDLLKSTSANEIESDNEKEIIDFDDTESFFENEISESTELPNDILKEPSRNVSKSDREIIVVGQKTVINDKPVTSISKNSKNEFEIESDHLNLNNYFNFHVRLSFLRPPSSVRLSEN